MSTTSTPRSRPRRGELSPTGINNRVELAKRPSSMSESVLRLGIIENSQLHKDIVQTIRQFTGYTKQYPNDRGRILPRNIGPDGNPRLEFNGKFMSMLETFLSDRKGGIIFFPHLLLHDADWEGCHVVIDGVEPRLDWSDAENKEDIRVNMALIFESLKNDGIPSTMKLDDANFFKSFDTEECFVCGSPPSNPTDNPLVKCHECHCHFHQQCYPIVHIPQEHEKWHCLRCNTVKDERAKKLTENEPKDGPEPSSKRRKSNHEPGRAYSRGSRTRTPSRLIHAPDETSEATTPASQYTRPASETPAPPMSSILPRNREHLLFLARRNARPIFRSVDLNNVHSVEGLFYACGAVWRMQVEQLYIYLPGSGHGNEILEVLAGSRTSFTAAMRMFQRALGNDQTVVVRILLLAEGESY